MSRPRVLFCHERPAVMRAVVRVLRASGFEVEPATTGDRARTMLEAQACDALVCDVAVRGVPGHELAEWAKQSGRARVAVLVASVYRRTSYKRRPTKLYGADDYVEIHHLGDQLPDKLRHHLGLGTAPTAQDQEASVRAELQAEGDARMSADEPDRLAELIVADMVLYNGEALAGATSFAEVERAVAEDLQVARDLFGQVYRAEGRAVPSGDPVGDELRNLMRALGRE